MYFFKQANVHLTRKYQCVFKQEKDALVASKIFEELKGIDKGQQVEDKDFDKVLYL